MKDKEPILFYLKITEQAKIPMMVADARDLYFLGIGHARNEAGNRDLSSQQIVSAGIHRIEECLADREQELENARDQQKKPGKRQPWPARINLGTGYEYIMVVVDHTLDTKTNAAKFAAMLNVGQKRDGRGGVSKTKQLKTALRDLAAAALYSRGVEWAVNWTETHHLQNRRGEVLAFYGRTTAKDDKNEPLPLYADASEWSKAKARAEEMFAGIFCLP